MEALFKDILSSAVHASAATESIAAEKHDDNTLVKMLKVLVEEVAGLKKQNEELLSAIKTLNEAHLKIVNNPIHQFNQSKPIRYPYTYDQNALFSLAPL